MSIQSPSPKVPSNSLVTTPTLFCPKTASIFGSKPKKSDMKSTVLSPCSLVGPVSRRMVTIGALALGNNGISFTGRITHKSEIRFWYNAHGQGMPFSFDLSDGSGEITVSSFSDQVQNLYPTLLVNDVVEVSGFRIKQVDPKFARITSQSLEVSLNAQGIVHPSSDTIPEIKFDFQDVDFDSNFEIPSLKKSDYN